MVLKDAVLSESPSFLKKLVFWKRRGMKLNQNDLKRDVIRIQNFYRRRGFDEVSVSYRVEKISDWKKKVIFSITERRPIIIESVHFIVDAPPKDSLIIYNAKDFQKIKKKLPYKKHKRYETVKQTEVESRIEEVLRDTGYPYAKGAVRAEIDSVSKKADVYIEATAGPRARFGSITVEGNEKMSAEYIKKEAGISSGDRFGQKKLRDAQREVFSHHMFRFALISVPEQPKDSTLDIRFRVKENPLRSVQLQFGVGNFTRVNNVWAEFYKFFRGRASWTHRNVRGRGERFTVSANASAIEQRLSTDYLFPYLFNTKSSLVLSPFIEHKLEPSYEILRGGFSNSFVYHYSEDLTGSISYDYYQNKEIEKSADQSLPGDILTYNISTFGVTGVYSESYSRGEDGWSVQPFWRLSGLFGESTYSYQKTGIDVRRFTAITDNITFAKRVQLTGIYYSKQDSLPSEVRVFNGGTSSVRGWNRQELGPKRPIFTQNGKFDHYVPTGGRATFSFNTELRFKLNQLIKGFGMAAFLDGGQVWSALDQIGHRPIQLGVGGGFRYQSPIGPVRLDLAYKINPTKEDLNIYNGTNYGSNWNYWGLHISIGQAF